MTRPERRAARRKWAAEKLREGGINAKMIAREFSVARETASRDVAAVRSSTRTEWSWKTKRHVPAEGARP